MFLAAGIIMATSIPVRAEEKKTEKEIYGDTTLSIVQIRQNPGNVSFTVPLFVTMAVIEGETEVKVPDAYTITNTCSTPGITVNDPHVAPFDIAVTKMTFEKLTGSSYKTVAGPEVSEMGEIMFQIGGLTMPALDQAGSKEVDLRAEGSQFLEDPTPGGYRNSKLKKIQAEAQHNTLSLGLKGRVSNKDMLSEQTPVAQFQVTYIISPLIMDDTMETVYKGVYAGNDFEQAGSPTIPD